MSKPTERDESAFDEMLRLHDEHDASEALKNAQDAEQAARQPSASEALKMHASDGDEAAFDELLRLAERTGGEALAKELEQIAQENVGKWERREGVSGELRFELSSTADKTDVLTYATSELLFIVRESMPPSELRSKVLNELRPLLGDWFNRGLVSDAMKRLGKK